MNATAKRNVLLALITCLSALVFSTVVTSAPAEPSVVSAEQANQVDPGIDPGSSLRSRIGPPDPLVLETYSNAGAMDITTHNLSDEEWVIVEAALARLPELHRLILQQHLKRLTFLDLSSGGGSALTSRVGPDEDSNVFSITLRASLITETLTEFLNNKEANLFAADASGYRIQFDAGSTDALTYVLIHEATHVVDNVLGLTADILSPLMAGTWEDAWLPADPYRSSLAAQTRFRGASRIPMGEAATYYRALSETPFVSFYATAAASEDVAELFAWAQLSARLGQRLTLSVLDESGQIIFQYEPLESPLVKERFVAAEEILGR